MPIFQARGLLRAHFKANSGHVSTSMNHQAFACATAATRGTRLASSASCYKVFSPALSISLETHLLICSSNRSVKGFDPSI